MNTKIVVKKCFGGFADIVKNKDSYTNFDEQFGKFSTLAIQQNWTNQTEITELVLFSTSKSGGGLNRLKEYVDRMEVVAE